MTKREWLNTNVTKRQAELLGSFLYENDIEFEESEYYDRVHFEVNVDEYELDAVNSFLDELTENWI